MDTETTLVTFLYESPSTVRTVELLGSWDNFRTPYAMERDARRGGRHWVGCYRFQDIICDGAGDVLPEMRAGGLKMGGRYWFFYRINGDVEVVDHRLKATTHCSMLPGQQVNILDVPTDIPRATKAPRTPTERPQFTRNPSDRFLRPRAAPSPQQSLPKLVTTPSTAIHSQHPPSATDSPITPDECPLYTSQSSSTTQLSRGRSKSITSSPSTAIKSLLHIKGRPTTHPDQSLSRSRSRAHRDRDSPLEIGTPVLVSRTDKNRRCTPIVPDLPPLHQPADQTSPSSQPFSPLRCHPVTKPAEKTASPPTGKRRPARPPLVTRPSSEPVDGTISSSLRRWAAQQETVSRPRSCSYSGDVIQGVGPTPLRNEVSSQTPMVESEEPAWPLPASTPLVEPMPRSSSESSRSADLDKDLPSLPPAVQLQTGRQTQLQFLASEPGSHFSAWTYDTTLGDEPMESPTSPTFSHSTATSSSMNTPARWSMRSHSDPVSEASQVFSEPEACESTATLTSAPTTSHRRTDSAHRRQGMCFDGPSPLNKKSLNSSTEDELRSAVKNLHQAVMGTDPSADQRDALERIFDDYAYMGELL